MDQIVFHYSPLNSLKGDDAQLNVYLQSIPELHFDNLSDAGGFGVYYSSFDIPIVFLLFINQKLMYRLNIFFGQRVTKIRHTILGQ
jgi:hypothetical protein